MDKETETSSSKPTVESHGESARIALKNSTAFLIGDAAIKLLSLIFTIYVVREFGDERLGVYKAALAYTGIFSILADLGMTQYATREIARGRRTADDMFWDMVVIRLFLSAVATGLITLSAAFVPGYDNKVFGVFLACLGFFGYALLGPVQIVLQAHERLEYFSILTTLVQVFFVGVGAVVLFSGYEVHALIIATYIGVPFAALLGMRFIRRLNIATLKLHFDPQTWLPILRFSLPFAMITFTLMAAKDLDTVLLSVWRSDEEVGWYRAAYDLIFKLLFIRTAILKPLAPQMARHYGTAPERVGQSFNFAAKLLWTLTLPVAIGTSILATPLIELLYTPEYANSAIVLATLIWSFPILSLSSLCGLVSTATDKEKQAVKVYTFAALVNLGTNLVAIPIWGYIGAAASTVLTEIVTLYFFYRLVHNEFPITDWLNAFIKPTLAGVSMGLIVLLMQGNVLWLTVVVGMVTYPIFLLMLRPFTVGELATIKELVGAVGQKIGLGGGK